MRETLYPDFKKCQGLDMGNWRIPGGKKGGSGRESPGIAIIILIPSKQITYQRLHTILMTTIYHQQVPCSV